MPAFDLNLQGGVRKTWGDHDPRINPSASGRSPSYYSVPVGAAVVATAIVDGVTGPMDAGLAGHNAGRTFRSFLGEFPAGGWMTPTSLAGQSSYQRFVPMVAGHYLWTITMLPARDSNGLAIDSGGGTILVHLEAE